MALVALVGELCQRIVATVAVGLDKMRASAEELPNRHKLDVGKTLGDALDEPFPRIVALSPSVALSGTPV